MLFCRSTLLLLLESAAVLHAFSLQPELARSAPKTSRACARASAPSPSLLALQWAVLPAALGTVAIINSNFENMYAMNAIRYAVKGKDIHPYRPWADDRDDAEAHFRAFKACQNGAEWTGYAVPILWLYVLYTPAVPLVGRVLPWGGFLLALAFAEQSKAYVKAYIASAESRVAPFERRTWCFRGMFIGFALGFCSSLVRGVHVFMLSLR